MLRNLATALLQHEHIGLGDLAVRVFRIRLQGAAIEVAGTAEAHQFGIVAEQIAGHALSSIFLDGLAVDIERMQRINRTLLSIPPEIREQSQIPLRPVKTLIISPSERIDRIAAEHAGALPAPVRFLLRGIGAMNRHGGALTSYLLFERPFTRALIDLGYADTMARDTEVGDFLGL